MALPCCTGTTERHGRAPAAAPGVEVSEIGCIFSIFLSLLYVCGNAISSVSVSQVGSILVGSMDSSIRSGFARAAAHRHREKKENFANVFFLVIEVPKSGIASGSHGSCAIARLPCLHGAVTAAGMITTILSRPAGVCVGVRVTHVQYLQWGVASTSAKTRMIR